MHFSEIEINILVIEDNYGDFILIEDYLTEEFRKPIIHNVKTFSQAESVLASEKTLDAILLDLTLPDLSGEELVTKIISLAADIPVIVLTGYNHKEFGVQTLSMGISDYLLKDELNAAQLYKSISYSIERKKVALKLKESEEKYRCIFKNSPIPMWTFDLESLKVLNVNYAAVEHYGYTRDEFLKLTIKDLRPAEDVSFLKQEVDNFKKSESNYKNIVRHQKKNGEVILVDITSNIISLNGRKASIVHANDVTERLSTELALQRSEKRFKALVQEGADLIGIIDLNGKYKYVSPTSESILGILPGELIGKCAFDFIHEEDKGRIVNYLSLLKTQKRVTIAPYRFRNAKGEWRWLETTATNLIEEPAVGGIVANSRDITERINYINAIQQKNEKLTEITWIQSHVVRAPLARILGLVNLIVNHTTVETERCELLAHVLTSANELDNIIRDIVKNAETVKNIN